VWVIGSSSHYTGGPLRFSRAARTESLVHALCAVVFATDAAVANVPRKQRFIAAVKRSFTQLDPEV
jgi:hypothetical protein